MRSLGDASKYRLLGLVSIGAVAEVVGGEEVHTQISLDLARVSPHP